MAQKSDRLKVHCAKHKQQHEIDLLHKCVCPPAHLRLAKWNVCAFEANVRRASCSAREHGFCARNKVSLLLASEWRWCTSAIAPRERGRCIFLGDLVPVRFLVHALDLGLLRVVIADDNLHFCRCCAQNLQRGELSKIADIRVAVRGCTSLVCPPLRQGVVCNAVKLRCVVSHAGCPSFDDSGSAISMTSSVV